MSNMERENYSNNVNRNVFGQSQRQEQNFSNISVKSENAARDNNLYSPFSYNFLQGSNNKNNEDIYKEYKNNMFNTINSKKENPKRGIENETNILESYILVK
jgi:hypothetical protein